MNERNPKPLGAMPPDVSSPVEWVFMDIDDTITSRGVIPSHAFEALWLLHEAGFKLVPVTGRPAGWCDHIARMWPVAGVVGENGGFYFRYDRGKRRMERSYSFDEGERERFRRGFERIRKRVLEEVKGCAVAADQPFRISDLAIDYCEDVKPLGEKEVRKIRAIAREEGATSRVSSIHVNCWYGDFDKVSCVRRFLEDRTSSPFQTVCPRILFVGDSHNDEPLFREIPLSVGVANIKKFLHLIDHLPAYITEKESAAGFRELADFLHGRKTHS
jgi:hypothetical protein